MRLAWLVLIVFALAGGVWWWRRGSDRPVAPAPAPGGGAALRPDPAGRVALPVPAALRRPVDPSAPAVAPADVEPTPPPVADSVPFDREPRDATWAADQERELKLRLDRLAVDLAARGAEVEVTAAECRRTMCRVELSARGTSDLSAAYGALETPEGLYGWADAVLLQEVETDLATSRVTTSVIVQFDRDP